MINSKSLSIVFAALASLSAAASPLPNDAASTCPSLGGQLGTINGGAGAVKVECNTWYYGFGAASAATTQQECAQQCHASACQASIWHVSQGKCYPITTVSGGAQAHGDYITFRPDHTYVPSTCQLPTSKACNAGGNNEIVQVGGVPMKKKCNGWMAKASMSLLKVVTGVSHEECAMLCALNSACKGAYNVEVTQTRGECQLQRNDIEAQFVAGNPTPDVLFVRL